MYVLLILNTCLNLILQKILNNVTGPPGALLFEVKQRSHWNNHYNCSFVRLAAWGIYWWNLIWQMTSQVKYPMQFMLMITQNESVATALSEEMSSTELQQIWQSLVIIIITLKCIEWEWHKSLPSIVKIYEITKNMKFTLQCSEHLVFKLFLIPLIQNINIWTHLALDGHRKSLWTTR